MTNNPEIRVFSTAGTEADNDKLWKKTVDDTLLTKANVDLTNLSPIGQAKFNSKASVSLDNLNTAGELRFTNKASIDLDNLSPAGEAKIASAGGGGDVSSSISSTTDGKVAVFDGITGKIIKDTTITGMLKASSGVLTQAISDTDYVSVSAFSTLDGRVDTAETDIGTLESSLTSKASIDLDNISSAGVAVIQSYATGGADVDLSNLSSTGNAKFTAKANISLDNINSAGIAVIQSYATGGANTDLSNLSATG